MPRVSVSCRMSSEQLALIPGRNFAVRFQGRKNRSFETALAMDDDALVFPKLTEQIRLNFVLFHLRVRARVHPAGITVGGFLDLLLTKEIGALDGAGFVGRFENHSVSEIEREHLGLFFAEWRDE